jgi:Na+-transporting methylmalonyl-CoA/oxaloacetate decarboxylase gamma subunit
MQMFVFILVSLLALWWLFCTLSAISSHRARLSLSPEERGQPEEREQIKEVRPPRDMHPVARVIHAVINAVIVIVIWLSFVLVMLPFYVHAWFVRDPDKRHDHVA